VADSINIQYAAYPTIHLGADTILCEGDILNLQVPPQNQVNYLWPDSSTQLSYAVTDPGAIVLQAQRFHCETNDTIEIDFEPYPQLTLGRDTILCEGNSLTLDATFPGVSYRWNDSSTQATLLVNEPGSYAVTIRNNCSTATDSIQLGYEAVPQVDLGEDTILCEGELLALDATFSRSTYLWQDGSTSPDYLIAQSGIYSVLVENLCGEASDEVEVTYQEVPPLSLGQDTTLCIDDILFLDVYAPNSSFRWHNGDTRPGFEVREAGRYHVELSHRCGTATDSIAIAYQHCDCRFFLANAFSPNGDQINDEFGPSFACTYKQYRLQIYNRWGHLMFETQDPSQHWDGTVTGRSVPEGVYVWVMRYESAVTPGIVEQKGSVMVIR